MGDSIKIPHAIEVLVAKASVDETFRKKLLEKRSKAAEDLKILLDDQEKALLDGIPEAQLKTFISAVKIPEEKKEVLRNLAAVTPGLIEYGLILGIIGFVAFSALTASGGGANPMFGNISGKLYEPKEKFCNSIVNEEFRGKSFLTGIKQLEKSQGISIQVVSPPELQYDKPINFSTKGIRMETFIFQFSKEIASPGFAFDLKILSEKGATLVFTSLESLRKIKK